MTLRVDFTAEMVGAYRTHLLRLRPYPGIVTLLQSLRERRARLGIVSDGYLEVQRAKFQALGVGHFSAVVFSDEFGRENWKPSPRPFGRVLELLGVPAAEAVYVGGNCGKDFLGARAWGMSTVWATYSGGEYCGRQPPTKEHAADLVAETIEELGALLGPAPDAAGAGRGEVAPARGRRIT